MFEGVDYHNQSKHFLYTANPGSTLNLPDYFRGNPLLIFIELLYHSVKADSHEIGSDN